VVECLRLIVRYRNSNGDRCMPCRCRHEGRGICNGGIPQVAARSLLVGVTLLYVEGPAAGGGEPAVGLVKTRAMVKVGQVLE
jgi:hypothetical protein